MSDNVPMTANAATVVSGSGEVWTREQIDLIKRMAAPGATDDELRLFLYQCKRLDLDPLLHHAYFIRRPTEIDGQWQMVGTIQVGIDGLRLAAFRTGQYAGQVGPEWCGPDGEWHDVWLSPDPPAAARVGVYRQGWDHPVWGVARWTSYVQRRRDGKPTRAWAQMPDLMLAKCSEALALRRAFPDALSGVYIPEESAEWTPPEPTGVAPASLADHVNQLANRLTPAAPPSAVDTAPSQPVDEPPAPATDESPPPPADAPAPSPPRPRHHWTLMELKQALINLGVAEGEIAEWIAAEVGDTPPSRWTDQQKRAVFTRLGRAWEALQPPDGEGF